MSLSAASSQYFQALQVQKNIKLREYKVDTERIQYTQSLTETYRAGEIDPKPKKAEEHKLDIIG